jgi:hypothetical protein
MFIPAKNDPGLVFATDYLTQNYKSFINMSQILAAFKKYFQLYTKYQIIYKNPFGYFSAIALVQPKTIKIVSIKFINFNIMSYSYKGCQTKNEKIGNCTKCMTNYINIKGRCSPKDLNC